MRRRVLANSRGSSFLRSAGASLAIFCKNSRARSLSPRCRSLSTKRRSSRNDGSCAGASGTRQKSAAARSKRRDMAEHLPDGINGEGGCRYCIVKEKGGGGQTDFAG